MGSYTVIYVLEECIVNIFRDRKPLEWKKLNLALTITNVVNNPISVKSLLELKNIIPLLYVHVTIVTVFLCSYGNIFPYPTMETVFPCHYGNSFSCYYDNNFPMLLWWQFHYVTVVTVFHVIMITVFLRYYGNSFHMLLWCTLKRLTV